MLGSPGLFVTWGWGLYCCWAFVPQMSPMLGWDIVEVRWCLLLPLETK